ncbi:MAG TPA: carboxypeptidase-like regulatory domain-containing protein, partial [Lacibacter sp.]|nr:carboxypeptidase-like regulatory domain-containing protein [Lacibacter sp.]
MNASEMHAFERAMMDDPMLADAVDGYDPVIGKRDIDADLAELKTKLNSKKENGKVITGFFRPWISVAAGIAIVLTAVLFYRNQNQNSPVEIVAIKEQKTEDTVPVVKETIVDSTAVAINDAQPVLPVTPKVLPLKKSKQAKDNAPLTENKSDFAKTEAVAAPPILNEVVIAPVSPKPAAAFEKKNEAFNYSTDQSQAKTKSKLPTLNKFMGVVVDENNNPLPFANITEVRSGVGTYADAKGNFTMIAADSIISIETRSVGYGNANVLLRNNQQQKIVLKDEAVIANAPTGNQLFERNRNRASAMKEEVTEMESEPADGWDKYSTYVLNNLRTPDIKDKERYSNADASKEVELSFDVNPDGSIA